MKLDKPHNVTKVGIEKIVPFVTLEVATIVIVNDNIMVVIQTQIGKNIVKDVLLNGGCNVTSL
jgi:hypothetical protein